MENRQYLVTYKDSSFTDHVIERTVSVDVDVSEEHKAGDITRIIEGAVSDKAIVRIADINIKSINRL